MFEAVDHAKAYDYMFTLLVNKEITEQNILYLHKLFYHNIDEEFAGRYRDISVFISGSNYPVTKVENIKNEIENLCKWIKAERKKIMLFSLQLFYIKNLYLFILLKMAMVGSQGLLSIHH